ncbi:MAG: hypothetical protein GC204_07050 [Chloroflexi bacterium]|nr:hypothetical protein [Chloroflexota bacterium]
MRRPPQVVRKWVFAVMPLLLIGIIVVLARQIAQADGRINEVAHFGGDALYCVDANHNPTDQLPTTDPKGFRLLNMNGQELWYVPGHDVEAALAKSVIGGDWELIAEGSGSYGPVSLHTYNVGGPNGIFYVFTGYDEHGKTNSLTFQSCRVGPAVGSLPTASLSASVAPTDGPSPTPSSTPTDGPSPTASDTATATSTGTATDTATSTATSTATATATDTATSTATATATDTATNTATATATNTATDPPS